MPTTLDGIVVLERAGGLPGTVAATLLGELGATVLRVEDPALIAADADHWRDHPLALADKTRIALSLDTPDGARQWRALLDRADVVICSSPLPPVDETPDHLIQCDISAFGRDGGDPLPNDANEAILQAIGGMMSTTGALNGPPEFIRAPLVELFTGFNCATAVLAALRVREAGGPAQRIDMSAFDTSVTLIGAFIGQVQVGEGHGLRLGSSHALVSPWNAYPTTDGWVLMCSSTDHHWERIRGLIGQDAVKDDPRFTTMTARKQNHEAVDELVAAWTRTRSTADAVAGFEAATIPAGPILTIPELLSGADRPPTRAVTTTDGQSVTCAGSVFSMSETPVRAAPAITDPVAEAAVQSLESKPETAAKRSRQDDDRPLAGVRVVEVSIFTAGPMGGRYLADLGAEVIKIEQPGGEGGRAWAPNFGGVSGYFATYNAGKRSVTLDLRQSQDQAALHDLIGGADVFLQNLKAGALDRLGFGPQETLGRHPSLIYCSVSGYGSTGSHAPALDTVIQAKSGLMSLIGAGDDPIKVGVSVADLLASHISPAAILAALRYRDSTGKGQHLDISMHAALAWMTQLNWPNGDSALPPCCRLTCSDGWVVAAADTGAAHAALDSETKTQTCDAVVAALTATGIVAAKVLELDEIFAHPLSRQRELFRMADTEGGEPAPVLASPFRLMQTPPQVGRAIAAPGADNDLIAHILKKAAS